MTPGSNFVITFDESKLVENGFCSCGTPCEVKDFSETPKLLDELLESLEDESFDVFRLKLFFFDFLTVLSFCVEASSL